MITKLRFHTFFWNFIKVFKYKKFTLELTTQTHKNNTALCVRVVINFQYKLYKFENYLFYQYINNLLY